MAENFNEEWFGILKRDMRDLTETKYSLMSILNKLKDVTTQTPYMTLYNLMSKFNEITLVKLEGVYPRVFFSWNFMRGQGANLKAAQMAIEAWLAKKASTPEIARLRREYEKFKKITEEE